MQKKKKKKTNPYNLNKIKAESAKQAKINVN